MAWRQLFGVAPQYGAMLPAVSMPRGGVVQEGRGGAGGEGWPPVPNVKVAAVAKADVRR